MIAILLAPGFEEMEAAAPCDLLRRAGAEVRFCGVGGTTVVGSHGITFCAEDSLDTLDFEKMDMLVLPGGMRGVKSIRESAAALDLIRRTHTAGKRLAAICAAPTILAELGLLEGKTATCYPDMQKLLGEGVARDESVVVDGSLITGRAAGSSFDFGLALVEAVFDRQTAERIAFGIRYRT